MNTKEKIIETAKESFLKYGFKKTTVDEISFKAGISKKTLYKIFPTKKDILLEIVSEIQNHIMRESKRILNLQENAVFKLFLISRVVGNQIRNVSNDWVNDIKNYHKDIWEQIEIFRRNIVAKNFSKLLKQGKKEGLIIDYPEAVVINLLLSSAESVTDNEFILNNDVSIQAALRASLEIIINGILTPAGRKVFKKAKKGILK